MSFNNKTIEELHNLLVSKEISATELTQATIDDIKAVSYTHLQRMNRQEDAQKY